MKKELKRELKELIYNQIEMVKYMNESTTREEKKFCKRCVDEYESLIESVRNKLGLS